MDMTLGLTEEIIAECKKQGLLRNQAAYVLATAYWESGRTMQPVKEAYWLTESWRKANLRYYPWYGRGLVQLTWKDNYEKAGAKIGRDLTTEPNVVMEPEISVRILVQGMWEGWFTGKKLSDYITLQASNFAGARRIVNGTDKAHAIAELAREYDITLAAMVYGVKQKTPITNDSYSGRPPRSSLLQSTEMRAIAGVLTGGGAGTYVSTFADLEQTVQLAVLGTCAFVALAGLVWLTYRRRSRWNAGER